MKNIVCIIICIMLGCCFLTIPYGYYNIVRFVSMIVFGWFAYDSYKAKEKEYFIIFSSLALLFQPFVKIALGRTIWNIIDVVVIVYLLIYIYRMQSNNNRFLKTSSIVNYGKKNKYRHTRTKFFLGESIGNYPSKKRV